MKYWAVFFALFSGLAMACQPATDNKQQPAALKLLQQPQLVAGKRLGLVVNQSSQVGGCHLVDLLVQQGASISAIFAPEHGFRGTADAGAEIKDGVDSKSGLPVYSLYGKNKKPATNQLQNIDVILFDIQDVGVRYYTYLSTLHYVLESAAEQGKEVWVLDRPNPNGAYVDGPMLKAQFRSFVGMHEIPLLHGMTLGELAQMIKGEGWINDAATLKLQVLTMAGYQRQQPYDLPVRPSPNLPNAQAIALYPSLGFFEATPLSVGRGTDFPFQVIGYTKPALGESHFKPVSTPGAALNPPLKDQDLTGQDLRAVKTDGLDLGYLLAWYQLFASQKLEFFNAPNFMDKLAGTDELRKQMEQGWTKAQIRHSWQRGLYKFRQQRQPYLLYPDWPVTPE